jgi:hypothetical protein
MPRTSKQKSNARAPLARYANYFEVGHNPYEFLIDFGQYRPEAEEVVLHTRIAVSPTHSKLLAEMLSAAVQKYEAENGRISEIANHPDPLEMVLRSLPDFERRAVEARRKSAAAAILAADNGSKKRR